MVLRINLGIKKEKRLKRHLEKEHPSTRGNINVRKEGNFKTKQQINQIVNSVPDYEEQAEKFIKL